jgi:DnaJ-domain-containing protein 1
MKDLSDSKSLDFIIKLIDNILQDKEEIYFYAIELMTGLSEQQVLQMTAEELLAACMDYLAINNPIYLHKFCTSLGYRHGIIE